MSLRPVLVHSCFDQSIGVPRPAKCRCRYRISLEDAREYVQQGKASWLIVDYKNTVPVESWNLVWGRTQEAGEETETRGAFAKQTPRVQTIERAHMERAYVDGKKADIERINAWGELQHEVWTKLTVDFIPNPWGEGRPLVIDSNDLRSSVGQTVSGIYTVEVGLGQKEQKSREQ